jgi:hypothetical protein
LTCPSGQTICGSGCCPVNQACCPSGPVFGFQCQAPGRTCCTMTGGFQGNCGPSEFCCPGLGCCITTFAGAGASCCPSSIGVTNQGPCCPAGYSCCPGAPNGCCPPGQTCCPGAPGQATTCCPAGTQCCPGRVNGVNGFCFCCTGTGFC